MNASPAFPAAVSRGETPRLYTVKAFGLSFLLTSVLAPAATFGLVWLIYALVGIDTYKRLESLTILDEQRQAIVFASALLTGVLLALLGRALGGKMRVPSSSGPLLLPLLLLLLSVPCLLLIDQIVLLHLLDNPFSAARHLLMYREGWGLLLFVWQMLFILGFVFGAPKPGQRNSAGLPGSASEPPREP